MFQKSRPHHPSTLVESCWKTQQTDKHLRFISPNKFVDFLIAREKNKSMFAARDCRVEIVVCDECIYAETGTVNQSHLFV